MNANEFYYYNINNEKIEVSEEEFNRMFDNGEIEKCNDCEEYFLTDLLIFTHNDTCYCEDCLNENAFYCNDCQEYYDNDYANYYTIYNGNIVCGNCIDNFYSYCDDCQEYYENTYYCEDCDCYVCEDCEDRNHNHEEENVINVNDDLEVLTTLENTEEKSVISSYHDYNRSFNFYCLENEEEKFYMGVELEVENNGMLTNDKVATFLRKELHCITAKDGSLNTGFEIISDVQSFKYWLYRKPKIEKIFKILSDVGIKSHDTNTCGLHIHVDKKMFGSTPEEVEKTVNKLYLIFDNFEEELKDFSRRNGRFNYCKFLSDEKSNYQKNYSLDTIDEVRKQTSERYQVINTRNSNTIEFRLFKGTLNSDTFYASLELIYNLVNIAKNEKIEGLTWLQIVKKNSFEELINYSLTRTFNKYKKLKNHTDQVRKQLIIEENKLIKLANKQIDLIKKYQNYLNENVLFLVSIDNLKNALDDNYHLRLFSINRKITLNLESEEPTKIEELNLLISKISRIQDAIYDCLCNRRKKSKIENKNEFIYYYDESLINNINLIYELIEEFKKEVK